MIFERIYVIMFLHNTISMFMDFSLDCQKRIKLGI